MTHKEFRIGDAPKILLPKYVAIEAPFCQGACPRGELPVGITLLSISSALQRDCVQESLAAGDCFPGEHIQKTD